MQLSYAEDKRTSFLYGNPQVTFFKMVYRRHTHFCIESIEQPHLKKPRFGGVTHYVVQKVGDLLHNTYLTMEFEFVNKPDATAPNWEKPNAAYALLEYVAVTIGGTEVDRHTGEWLFIWHELTTPAGKKAGLRHMTQGKNLILPLGFWFCRHAGLALPLVALQTHDVIFEVKFREPTDVFRTLTGDTATQNSTVELTNASLYVDYIYLDTEERRRFAHTPHEYLIERTQHIQYEHPTDKIHRFTCDVRIPVQFPHSFPVKELIWCAKMYRPSDPHTVGQDYYAHGEARFVSEGREYEGSKNRRQRYFTLVQPYYHHTAIPNTKNVCVLCFALYPEEQQPSGTCRIKDAALCVALRRHTESVDVYCVGYSILRFMSGAAGLTHIA